MHHSFWKSLLVALLVGLGLAGLWAGRAGAQNATGVISGAPLKIQIYPNNSLQVWHERYTQGAAFGEAGSGFIIALNTNVYGGPYYSGMQMVSQAPTSGQGTRADPFRSVLVQQVNSGSAALQVTQTVLYVNGAQSFQLEWLIANTGDANTCFKAYHAADLYFADDDRGRGYYDPRSGSVGGFNQAKDWYMVFTPLTPASHYEEAHYRTIWNRLQNQENLADAVVDDYIDNGAALQWDVCLGAGQSRTISDAWSFGDSAGAIAAAVNAAGGGSYGPLGLGAEHFRPADAGSPALTTTIPTPLDISLAPEVVGANLLWAALAAMLFTVASELFNRTLADYEVFFERLFRPLKPVNTWLNRAGLAERLGRPVWYERVKLVLIILIYGLIFSFLDNTWAPLSLNGVWLFICMALAFGVAGLADDIAQWNTARRWRLPTHISIRPGNLLLALLSMLFSRTLVLTPGVMFGTPEAFEIEPGALDAARRNRLLTLAGGVLLAIMAGSWLPTILSTLALRAAAGLPAAVQPFVQVPLAALQSLLLLIFAVTVQNLFLHMLALPDTIGEMIKRWNRIAWFFALLAGAYVYLQTLLNPNGDLAHSLQTSNVRVFIGTIGLFLLFTLVSRGLLKRFGSKTGGEAQPAAGSQPTAAAPPPAGDARPEALPTVPLPGAPGVPELNADVQGLLAGWAAATQEERMLYLQRAAVHGQPAVDVLVGRLADPDPAIRLAAVGAVGSLGDRACLPAVQALLNDPDPGVVHTAQWALGVLRMR